MVLQYTTLLLILFLMVQEKPAVLSKQYCYELIVGPDYMLSFLSIFLRPSCAIPARLLST
jgi:hypothetical protein